MSNVLLGILLFWFGVFWGYTFYQTPCPETLPTQVTDMFTIQGDTIYLKQDADFTISTRGIIVDTAGLIHRK